jgi:hypothetical protein
MSIVYELTVKQVNQGLLNLEKWIDKAHAFATEKKFDANTLLTARLAPDMIPLLGQVRIICDNAKFVCFRGAGKDAPSHPDNETTWDELRARSKNVRELITALKPSDFEGIENRTVSLSFVPGKVLAANDYVFQFGLKNFYFHLVTAYGILRHNGVNLGKSDFIGAELPFRDA